MSLSLIEAEIRRFLFSPDPEVLCITGKWGVGKTYGWKKFLSEAKRDDAISLRRYSYVSLFGLNSLDDLRFSIWENTVIGDRIGGSPDAASIGQLLDRGSEFGRRMKPMVDVVSAFFGKKGVADVIYKSAFQTVSRQIVCIDDLERAGSGLTARDVLGVASFLKEERACKAVLLLNEEEHDERAEFRRQLEKVADVSLTFDLTPTEAAAIAIPDESPLARLVKPRIVELGITNIRVIKKIERLGERLISLLDGYEDAIVQSAVTTLVLASWAAQQPNIAPPLQFIRDYNQIAIGMRTSGDEVDADTQRHRDTLAAYPFMGTDDLDLVVIDGAETGYFREDELKERADAERERLRKAPVDSAFSRAWRELYHGSLAIADDEFLDELHRTALVEAETISPLNINSAVRVLRQFGRSDQADEIVEHYIVAHEPDGADFFDISRHHFTQSDRLDEALEAAFVRRRDAFADERDPLDVLRSIGDRNGWNDADVVLMAKQTSTDFERMFEALKGGKEIRSSIQMALSMAGNEGREEMRVAIVDALRSIAAKSPLRAEKVRQFGVLLEPEAAPGGEPGEAGPEDAAAGSSI